MTGALIGVASAWGRALLWGKNGIVVVLIAAVLAAYAFQAAWHRDQGRKAERAAIMERGKKLNAKARKTANVADAPGSADRLRRKWCRDC